MLEPSSEPHRIYGETILPVPGKKTKIALVAGLRFRISFYAVEVKKTASEYLFG
ncbi:hypothetical protein [Chryseobacterium indoltheticum]|uniref:hypothetical protein n=1 Tax=Chryseobacterium indoltheticum TaxID=254 RepID=UPI003F4936B1